MFNQSITIASQRINDSRSTEDNITLPVQGYDAVALTLMAIGVISLFENTTVVWLLITRKTLQTHMNVFILFLAVVDVLLVVFSYPLVVVTSFRRQWILGVHACHFEGFIVAFLGYCSIFILCAISVDRYIVICRQDLSHLQTQRIATYSSAVCCAFAVIWAILPFLGWGSYAPEGLGVSCSPDWRSKQFRDWTYNLTILWTCFLVPLSIIIGMYIKIFHGVKRASRYATWGKQSRLAVKQRRMETRLAKTVALMIVAFLISWSPYAIVACWALLGNPDDIPASAATIPAIFAKASGIWNPIIYAATNKQIRLAFINVIPCSKLRFLTLKRQNMLPSPDTTENKTDSISVNKKIKLPFKEQSSISRSLRNKHFDTMVASGNHSRSAGWIPLTNLLKESNV